MAISNFFQTQKTSLVLLTFHLLLLNKVNSIDPVYFSFENFPPDGQDIIVLQGDAHITPKGQLQLTKVDGDKPVSNSLGRALYSHPIQIWDSITGHLASFETEFHFIINAPNIAKTAEGLAFFLAPLDTQPQKPGGYLGLFNSSNVDKSSKTLAVEFDTLLNEEWDTGVPQIGIDVNSITSINSTSWDFVNGQLANVEINYYGNTKTLTVSLNYPSNETSYTVETVVDLREVLPEWVRVGFSATTGLVEDYVETHDVLAWAFLSLDVSDDSSSSEAFKNKLHHSRMKMHPSV